MHYTNNCLEISWLLSEFILNFVTITFIKTLVILFASRKPYSPKSQD